MTGNLLSEATSAAREFYSAIDQMSLAIHRTEAQINGTNSGLACQVESPTMRLAVALRRFRFRKGARWCICASVPRVWGDEWTPFKGCRAEIKAEVYEALPALLAELRREAQSKATRCKAAIARNLPA